VGVSAYWRVGEKQVSSKTNWAGERREKRIGVSACRRKANIDRDELAGEQQKER